MELKSSKVRLHGLVVVPRTSGNVRLCIYMRQANKAVQSIPHVEDTKNGAPVFSKLDLTKSFHQIELEESSRYTTTFVCQKGLYHYNKLMFGKNSAHDLHQRIIQQTIEDIPGCNNLANDIIIYAKNQHDHDKTLHALLSRILKKKTHAKSKQMRIQQVRTEIYGEYIIERSGEIG